MGDKGSKDKAKREDRKKPKLNSKGKAETEERKEK